jgi:hypothetical protein
MHGRIAGNDCTTKLPFLGKFGQTYFPCIVHDVKADLGEGVPFALFASQNVIVRLVAYSDANRTPATIQVGQALRFISDTCYD